MILSATTTALFLLLLAIPSESGLDLNLPSLPKNPIPLDVFDDQQLVNLTNLINSVSQKGMNLSECYNPMIGDKKMDIFNTDFMDVLKHFQERNSDLFTLSNTPHRIQSFIESVFNLVNIIMGCTEKPEKKRTQYGVTRLTAYSKDEYKKMLGARLPKGINNRNKSNHSKRSKRGSPLDNLFNNLPLVGDYFYEQPDYGQDDGLSFENKLDQDCGQFFNYDGEIPAAFDWRDQGIVTPIKFQGDCGSCFIFSTTGAAESSYMQKYGQQVDFSEQAVLNCVDGGRNVCDTGGFEAESWYMMKQRGIVEEGSAPYQDQQQSCQDLSPMAEIDGYCNSYHVTGEQLQVLLLQRGPIIVDVNAEPLQQLQGNFNDDCSEEVNHSVLLVGWNEQYWIIKNSWGVDWGVDGYLYLDRSQDNKCGINTATGAVWVK